MEISKQRLKELEQTEQNHRMLIDALNEVSMAFALSNSNGEVVYINHRMRELIHHTHSKELSEALHPDDRERYQAFRNRIVASDSKEPIEVRYLSKENESRWLRITAKPVGNPPIREGKFRPFLAIVEDITDQKTAEENQINSQHRLQAHIESTPMGIIEFDNEFKVTSWNPAAEQIFGFSKEEVIGRNTFDFLVPDYERQVVRDVHQPSSPQSCKNINDNLTKDGRIITVEWINTPIHDQKGNLVGMTAACQDITEQLKTQQLLIQSEKMMSVGGLAAGMAHEINNPLGAIIQVTQNLERRLDPDFKKNLEIAEKHSIDLNNLHDYLVERGVLDYIGAIKESGKRAALIITNMLHFSRKSDSKKAMLSINTMLDRSLSLAEKDYDLKKKFDFKHIEIRKEFDTALTSVPCSETEIEQVLFNLLTNCAQALKSNPKDTPPLITLRTMRETGMARIEIEDNGPGMEESVRLRVFEPFYTTKPVGEGTGLGLSVSYSIITGNHLGTMEVESEPGQGTKFIIRLPLEMGSLKK